MKKIEEIEFEVSSKSGQLKRFLQKPPNERMPFEIIEVVQILKVLPIAIQKVSTFQRYFNTKSDTHQFAVLPTWTTLKSFSHLQSIYNEVTPSLFRAPRLLKYTCCWTAKSLSPRTL